MSDPRRLVEEGDLGGSLLSAALVLDADQARERKAALIGGAATVTLAAAAPLLPKSLVAAALPKSALIGIAITIANGAVIGALALAALEPTNAPPPAAAGARELRAAEAGAPRAPAEEPIAPSPSPGIDPSAASEIAPSASASAPDPLAIAPRAAPSVGTARARAARPSIAVAAVPRRDEPPAPASSSSSLAEEVAALQSARSALAAGQPARALAALEGHEQRFPGGLLGIEAEVLRIEALSRSGNAGAASARAGRFIALHPNTPYARYVQTFADDAPRAKSP